MKKSYTNNVLKEPLLLILDKQASKCIQWQHIGKERPMLYQSEFFFLQVYVYGSDLALY